jgi:MoaA/NifB/PqqE/SkfB family radical SAM enzyme
MLRDRDKIKKEDYLEVKKINSFAPLLLEGGIDLTYRCNNNCRHCWLRIPGEASAGNDELTYEEIVKIVDQANLLGCRRWFISGGEPLLREDFPEVFDYITRKSPYYSINTNGTLITPKIARLFKKTGTKLISLYGATAKVHDYITRTPGSFERCMRGFAYLKEAGAGFVVQLVPLRGNYHQFKKMVNLAESLSRHWRLGASWLYLSSGGEKNINRQITQQRISARKMLQLDCSDFPTAEAAGINNEFCRQDYKKEALFLPCINRNQFHVDPYGKTSFCCFVKDPALRYDLKKGAFKEYYEEYLPSLGDKIKITKNYKKNCGRCTIKEFCRWCPAYSYLEHHCYDTKIDYLCGLAKENKRLKDKYLKQNRRLYRTAGITIQVDSDLPFHRKTFNPKFKLFQVQDPGKDGIIIRHRFMIPALKDMDLGKKVYQKLPWVIYKRNYSWVYLHLYNTTLRADRKKATLLNRDGRTVNIYHREKNTLRYYVETSKIKDDTILLQNVDKVVVVDENYARAVIYHDEKVKKSFTKGDTDSLSLLPTDQILLAPFLAQREGFYLHSCGVNFEGKGFLFVGQSGAGKSTIAKMLKNKAEILCDEKMIVRKESGGFKIYGTWIHGDMKDISARPASLKAIFFLEKSDKNRIIRLYDKKEINKKILSCLIKPLATKSWWDKMLALINDLSRQTPFYLLYFDKSGGIIEALKQLTPETMGQGDKPSRQVQLL